MRYLALLRGINVGGNSKILMADLKDVMENNDLVNVRTYIQSGNVFFDSDEKNCTLLSNKLEALIKKHFDLEVPVAIFTHNEWQKIIKLAPSWWGNDKEMKHNLLVLLKPFDIKQAIDDIGELKPAIENMEPGDGVLYQSISIKLFGRTTTGKLASRPIYKRMTIRNYNTATKLLTLFED